MTNDNDDRRKTMVGDHDATVIMTRKIIKTTTKTITK